MALAKQPLLRAQLALVGMLALKSFKNLIIIFLEVLIRAFFNRVEEVTHSTIKKLINLYN